MAHKPQIYFANMHLCKNAFMQKCIYPKPGRYCLQQYNGMSVDEKAALSNEDRLKLVVT